METNDPADDGVQRLYTGVIARIERSLHMDEPFPGTGNSPTGAEPLTHSAGAAGATAALASAGPVTTRPGGTFCRGCGSALHPEAVVCPQCGVASRSTADAMAVALNSKSAGLAIVLSLLFTGAGHWYVGRVGRGFAFFGAAVASALLITFVVGLIVLPVIWIWAAVDANKCAQQHNLLLATQVGGQLPPGAFMG